jgi:outer membrane receptor protein involved in Fe transport
MSHDNHRLSLHSAALLDRASLLSTTHRSQRKPLPNAARSNRFKCALLATAGFLIAGQGSAVAADDVTTIETVVVTAQKQAQSLQDVPMSIAVIDPQTLVDNNKVLLRDYFNTVPGLSVTPDYVGQQRLAIRGIGSNANPTVSVLVDDVPFGATFAKGQQVPDIDPGDLQRIEVLRGPQGTLYGSDSMGGLIKFVTVDPSTDAYTGRVSAGTDIVSGSSQVGFDLRGSVNLPVANDFAIRVSAFDRTDPGFIDNPVYHLKDVNSDRAYGARISALWTPTSDLSIKVSAMMQDVEGDALNEAVVAPGLHGLQQNYFPGTGVSNHAIQAYSATINYNPGFGQITSVTGYNINKTNDALDFGFLLGPAMQFNYGVSGARYVESVPVRKLSQELRYTAPITEYADVLIGGYYTNEHQDNPPGFSQIYGFDTNTGQDVARYYNDIENISFEEYAIFGNVTFHLGSMVDLQLGGRESHYSYRDDGIIEGLYATQVIGVDPSISHLSVSGDVGTYSVSPEVKITDDIMAYARIATGYRPGGPNTPIPGLPANSKPDTTTNYEIGLKSQFFDNRVQLDVALYHIDWKQIQIQLRDPITHFIYNTNGGAAKSEGVELSATAKPWDGFTAQGSFSYDAAALTQAFPAGSTAVGDIGDRLPNTPAYQFNVTLNQDVELTDEVMGHFGGAVSFVGDRIGVFTSGARQYFPSYTTLDLNAGVTFGDWSASIYADNVTDTRGLLDGGIGYFNPSAFIYITPAKFGINLTRNF